MFSKVVFVIVIQLLKEATSSFLDADKLSTGVLSATSQVVSRSAKYIEQFNMFPDKSQEVQRNLTLSVVQKCDGRDGECLYVVYEYNVLDLTDFVKYHPAGPDPLKKCAGQDATQVMRSSGMPANVFNTLLKKFIIGKINLIMGEASRYTFAEVATRNGKNKQPIWIVYKDSVYDVSKYLYEHPGGADTIEDEAGKDATKAFDEVGHTSDARKIILKYKIGEIVEEEKRYDANGKKKKRVIAARPDGKPETRSCLNIITCGLVG